MEKIESKAIELLDKDELLGKDTFDSYLKLIKNIIENDKFDYIILIDRKGAAIFRAFLRVLKERAKEKKIEIKPIILSSRVVGNYSFKKTDNVLIFDDIINRGRNLCRIIKDLYRRGLKNISYTALAYREDLAETKERESEGDSVSICKNGEEMKIKIKDKIFKNENGEFSVGIEVFGITELSPFKEGEKGPKVCLSEPETKDLAEKLNKLIHYSMTPYTSYTAYARFGTKKFKDLRLNIPDNYEQLPYDVHVCEDVGVQADLYCEDEEYSLTTGYFSGIRVFTNEYDTEGETEYLIRPCFFLPPLKKEHIDEMFEKLNFNTINLSSTRRNFSEGETGESPDHISFLEKKTELEIKIRLVTSVLTAIKGIKFALNAFSASTEITKNEVGKIFAKSFARYFLAKDYGDNYENYENYEKCLQKTADFLDKATKVVNENEELFNFKSNKYHAESSDDYYLLNYTDYIDKLGSDYIAIKKDIEEIIKEVEGGYATYAFVKKRLEKTEDDFPRFFSELSIFLDNVDEKVKGYKLLPIPLAETIRLIHKEGEYPEYLFPEIIAAFDACIEDGSMGDCVYVECMDSDDNSFVALHYYQHGELALLEYWKRFLAAWKYLINNINGSLELCADGMTDFEIKTMMNDYKNIVSERPEGFLKKLLSSTFIVFNRDVAVIKALLKEKNFYSIVEKTDVKNDGVFKGKVIGINKEREKEPLDEDTIVTTLSRVAGIWRGKLIKQRIDRENEET
ncbi:MAG: phosphoribosyltransferase [Oscillospiraceae bacterium]|nr:phosphoribosyltransferase [Oscillospiraceae bacterium]